MSSPDAIAEVASAIAQLWDEGCPVAAKPDEMAPIAVRRWTSSAQRGVDSQDVRARVRDLTKGLIAHFERDPAMTGPLRRDYECVAERVHRVMAKLALE